MSEITILEWDSSFFKKNIASVKHSDNEESLEEILKSLRENGIELAYIFSNKEITSSMLRNTYYGKLVDQKVIFFGKIKQAKKSTFITLFKGDPSCLYSLARQSGKYSRFNIDSNFPKEDFIHFYNKWIENSVNGQIADVVFVYIVNEVIKGLVTAKTKENKIVIGLLAVDQRFRGEGVGTALLNHLGYYALEKGLDSFEVATQLDNLSACSFYEKYGLIKNNITYIYHFWLKNMI